MRIIAGKHRGRNIMSIQSKSVRPTTSKAREALFSILTSGDFLDEEGISILEGATVADICCGTGALGLEALSRGAKKVIFIDNDPASIDLVKYNLRAFGEEANAITLRNDATLLPTSRQLCQVVFIDPPYESGLVAPILKSLAARGWLDENAVIICETGKREEITLPKGYSVRNQRQYGKTKLVILGWHEKAEEQDAN
jgi:16S rRNA (guanine966-N2)-methyltransferase